MPVGGVNPDQYIYVPSKFQIKPGAKIRNDLFVGPGLGVGLQVTQPLLQFAQEGKNVLADAGNSTLNCITTKQGLCFVQGLLQTTYVLLSDRDCAACRGEFSCCRMHRAALTLTKFSRPRSSYHWVA